MISLQYSRIMQIGCTILLLLMAAISVYGAATFCIHVLSDGTVALSTFEGAVAAFIALSITATAFGALTACLVSVVISPIQILSHQEPHIAHAAAIAIAYRIGLLANWLRQLGSIYVDATSVANALTGCLAMMACLSRATVFQTSHILAPHWVPGTSPLIIYH